MNSRAAHLTEAELVDLLDGTLEDDRRHHVDGCDECARQAAELVASARVVNDVARDVDVPEPPPFFWTQFSARVSEAVANEAAKPRIAAFAWARAPWMGAAAAVAAAALWMFLPQSPDGTPALPANTAVETAAAAHPDSVGDDEIVDLDSDEAWALVRSLAEDLDVDQMAAEGVSLGAGAAERLALQLTDAERSELARLLEQQLRKSGARESAS
jgi:hypothetical protein